MSFQKSKQHQSKSPNIEQYLEDGKMFELNQFILTKDNLTVIKESKNGDMNEVDVSPPLFVEKRFQSIHTNEMDMVVKLKVNNRYITEKIPMQTLTSVGSFLANKGLPVATSNVRDVQQFLIQQQRQTPVYPQYEHIGFIKDKGGTLFIGLSKAIGHPDKDVCPNLGKLPSDVSTNGSLIVWIVFVKQEVLGVIPLEFILGVAASALIVGYYSQMGQDKDSLLVQLVGTSTTGKTTAAQLAISLFGPPIKGVKKLFQSFSSTENALPRMLGNNFGVPFLIDELSLAGTKDLTNLIYLLGENREKGRMTETLELGEQLSWNTSIIMTGENSITSQTNNNLGLLVRLFEYEIKQWTKGANHADKIKSTVKQHYGHAGVAYADYLAQDYTRIVDSVEYWCEQFKQAMIVSDVRNRIAEKYAMILAGLELLGKALDIPFNVDKVFQFILNNEKILQRKRDIANSVFHDLIADVIRTPQLFHVNNTLSNAFNIKGLIKNQGNGDCSVYYLKSEFTQFLKQHGYTNETTVMSALKKKKYFKHEQGRATTRTKIAGTRSTTYEFIVPYATLKPWFNHL